MHFDETLYLELLYHILKSLIIELYHIIHIVSQNELFTFPFYSVLPLYLNHQYFPNANILSISAVYAFYSVLDFLV